jgi:hypothetical protein
VLAVVPSYRHKFIQNPLLFKSTGLLVPHPAQPGSYSYLRQTTRFT